MSRKDVALHIFSFPAPKPNAWIEYMDKWTSCRVRESPGTAHEFFSLSYSRILLFSFTFLLTQGTLPISWCPEIPFYVARHFVLIFFNEFSSAPTHPLNHRFVRSREDTERCWCFWLVFMPSVPLFIFIFYFFDFLMNIHVFLAVCTGTHLLEWHGSCLQVESDPCSRG